MSKKGKFLLGAGVGLGLGLLFAPKSGKETREDLANKTKELIEKAKEVDVEEVKNTIIIKTKELEQTLKDLDKETAVNIIKDKAQEAKIKAQELVDIAVEKGTPVLEKAAKDVKSKTAVVLKDVATKLETEPEKKTTKSTAKKTVQKKESKK